MAQLLNNSVFFHIGRTGGYWVRDVLIKQKLVVGELGSFHATPIEVRSDIKLVERDFSFCFVRHPLTWLKSCWAHERISGWANSAFPLDAQKDSFSDFIESLLDVYPNGPVSHFFDNYIENCTFTGRLENIREDLCLALYRGNEEFDPSIVRSYQANNESSNSISRLAVAPRKLLDKIMQSERVLCDRFGYSGYQESMVSDSSKVLADHYKPFLEYDKSSSTNVENNCMTPKEVSEMSIIQLRDLFDSGVNIELVEHDLKRRLSEFDFNSEFYLTKNLLINGVRPTHDVYDIRDLIMNEDFVGKSVIELGAGDAVFSLCAESLGASNVVAKDYNRHLGFDEVLSPFLKSGVEYRAGNILEVCESDQEQYDFVFVFNLLNHTLYPTYLLRSCQSLLKPGGKILISTAVMYDEQKLPLLMCPSPKYSPFSPDAVSFYNLSGLNHTLISLGFDSVNVHKYFSHGLNSDLAFNELTDVYGGQIKDERFSIVGRVLLSATKNDEFEHRYKVDKFSARSLLDLWDFGKPLYFSKSNPVFHNNDFVSMVERYESKINELQYNVNRLNYTLSDREHDLVMTRAELAFRGVEVDQLRDECHILRSQIDALLKPQTNL